MTNQKKNENKTIDITQQFLAFAFICKGMHVCCDVA